MAEQRKVAVVGLGSIGEQRAEVWNGRPRCRVTPGISQTSCGVLSDLSPSIQWRESYVTGNKIYCVYVAPDAELVREHARRGGFPANAVAEVRAVIEPTMAG